MGPCLPRDCLRIKLEQCDRVLYPSAGIACGSCRAPACWGSGALGWSLTVEGWAVAGVRGQREQWRDRQMPAVAACSPPLSVGADATESALLSVRWVGGDGERWKDTVFAVGDEALPNCESGHLRRTRFSHFSSWSSLFRCCSLDMARGKAGARGSWAWAEEVAEMVCTSWGLSCPRPVSASPPPGLHAAGAGVVKAGSPAFRGSLRRLRAAGSKLGTCHLSL